MEYCHPPLFIPDLGRSDNHLFSELQKHAFQYRRSSERSVYKLHLHMMEKFYDSIVKMIPTMQECIDTCISTATMSKNKGKSKSSNNALFNVSK
ncbi:hypothetical protein TNCT_546811 [Trichonephila clavata]|uniref:Uncharacterized protein n=1 Tax=Trichonephila clavata TaxID=2740835 RepID=A0A8X6GWT8_TRICU|nr:hypothetical protein TNCT_308621 [Trichonephila clavata]GFR12763.1 hypothetical protein TNCT_546811 [Trichonephila clavata]